MPYTCKGTILDGTACHKCDKCADDERDILQRRLDTINALDTLQGWVKLMFGDPDVKPPQGLLRVGRTDAPLDVIGLAEMQRLAFRELIAEIGRIKARLEGA